MSTLQAKPEVQDSIEVEKMKSVAFVIRMDTVKDRLNNELTYLNERIIKSTIDPDSLNMLWKTMSF